MAYTNNFTFTGTLHSLKETPDHPSHRVFESKSSDWRTERLNFGIKTGNSFQYLVIQGGYKKSGDGTVFYMTTNKEKKTVPFKKRNTVNMDDVAGFSQYVLDLNPHNKNTLERAAEDEELAKKLGYENIDEVKQALETYDSKKFRYLSAVDLLLKVEKLLKAPDYKDKRFTVTGNVTFSENEGKVYPSFEVHRVQLTKNNEDSATANIHFLLNEDSLESVDDDGSFMVYGWTSSYDNRAKNNLAFYPYSFRVMKIEKDSPEDTERANAIRRKRFTVKGQTIKECVIVVEVINGTEYRPITEEDLTDDERDAIFCGEVTLEELQREYNQVAGPTIRENRFVKLGRGYTKGGPLETDLTIDDLVNYKVVEKEIIKTETSNDDEVDLFAGV